MGCPPVERVSREPHPVAAPLVALHRLTRPLRDERRRVEQLDQVRHDPETLSRHAHHLPVRLYVVRLDSQSLNVDLRP
eukprot:1514779-Prymnesium_polylepis.1